MLCGFAKAYYLNDFMLKDPKEGKFTQGSLIKASGCRVNEKKVTMSSDMSL